MGALMHARTHARMHALRALRAMVRWMCAASVHYDFKDSGKCKIPIINQSECNAAAMYLNDRRVYVDDHNMQHFWTTSSVTETKSEYPPGCYYTHQNDLYLNKLENSSTYCSSDYACICKTGKDDDVLLSKLALGGSIAVRAAADATLTNDIIIKEGSIVFLDGGGRTLTTGTKQFRVEREARLCMYNFRLIDGKVGFSSFQVVRL